MAAPGFLVALDDALHARLHEEDLVFAAHVVQLVERVEQAVEGLAPPDVGDQGHPVVLARQGHAQLGKLRHELGGHVVHHVKAHVLQEGGRLALPRPGQAGNDDEVQNKTNSFLPPWGSGGGRPPPYRERIPTSASPVGANCVRPRAADSRPYGQKRDRTRPVSHPVKTPKASPPAPGPPRSAGARSPAPGPSAGARRRRWRPRR